MEEMDKQINATLEEDLIQTKEKDNEYTPQYKLMTGAKIPVSRKMGKFWKIRIDEGKRMLENSGVYARWEESIAAYERDHTGRAAKRRKLAEAAQHTDSVKPSQYSTENIVFSNVSALVPSIYAKNPDAEVTATKSENEAVADAIGALITTLFQRKNTPGLGLKKKLKTMVAATTLTNTYYCSLDWVKKQDSSEQAAADIEKIATQLADTKDIKDIEELEGQLMALDERVAILEPSGPKFYTHRPTLIIEDPNNTEGVFTENQYVIVGQMMRTSHLEAMYYNKDEETGEMKLLFEPTHVVHNNKRDTNINGQDEEIQTFMMLKADADQDAMKTAGYEDKDEYRSACRTMTWTVWDKSTRRVYLFSDKSFEWPLWVWDDPHELSRFYPIFRLNFQTGLDDRYGKSEVMYYLDQQDELNVVSDELSRMRHWISTKLFFDKKAFDDVQAAEQFLSSATNKSIHGINLPDGMSIDQVVGTMKAPSTQAMQLFDETRIIQSINRLSSVTPVLQAQQYKTNTTNKAIESYQSTTATRLDEKIDAVEEMLGEIGQCLFEMCMKYMTVEEIAELIGMEKAEVLRPYIGMPADRLATEFNLQIVGGSTNKPTSATKKEQAMHLGQVLGQFAGSSPMIVIAMLKMISRAYADDVVLTDNDWKQIVDGTMQQMQRGSAQQGGDGQQQGAQPNGEDQIRQALTQIGQQFDQLPPEAKSSIAKAFVSGEATFEQIVGAVTKQQPGNGEQQ